MNASQLQLVDVPTVAQNTLIKEAATAKPLTERQQAVLDLVTRAGIDGIDADMAGALLHSLKKGRWAHTSDERCDWCGRDGNGMLKRLAELGQVRYRRRKGNVDGAWLATGTDTTKPAASSQDDGWSDLLAAGF